jgi:hypothetical protein
VPPIADVIGPPPPADKIVTADSLNPRFRAHHPKATEALLEEMLDEKLSVKMITKDAAPVAFVVPDRCDSVQFSYGPIELNPGHGKPHDLDLIVTLGTPTIIADEGNIDGTGLGPLLPGSAIMVNVPWRAASFVDLPANRLKVTLYARFFSAIQPLSTT